MKLVQIVAVAFVDDIDLIIDREDAEYKMQLMLIIYNDLYLATGGYIEDEKCKFFAWIWKQKQGNKVIINKEVELEVNEKKVKIIPSKESE